MNFNQNKKNMAVSVLHLKLYGNLCILDKIKYLGKRTRKITSRKLSKKYIVVISNLLIILLKGLDTLK